MARGSLTHAAAGLLKAGVHFNIRGHRDPLPSRKRTPGMFSCGLSALLRSQARRPGASQSPLQVAVNKLECAGAAQTAPCEKAPEPRPGLCSPNNTQERGGTLRLLSDCSLNTATPGRGRHRARITVRRGTGRLALPRTCCDPCEAAPRTSSSSAKASFCGLKRACVIWAADARVTGHSPRVSMSTAPGDSGRSASRVACSAPGDQASPEAEVAGPR